MGWNIDLKSNKDITEEEIEQIVSKLPTAYKGYQGLGGKIRQDWGWSVAVDICNPKDNVVGLYGAYSISSKIGESFSHYFKGELEKIGHVIKLEYHW